MRNNQTTISSEKEIIDLFPEHVTEIKSLFGKEDENFKELATDFLFCQKEFKRLSKLGNMRMAHKYQKTIEDLEHELLDYLKKQKQM